jgi:hypothetical protein
MTAYYETFKRTDKLDDYVYRAIRYNIFKHRAINRLTYRALDGMKLSLIELLLIWIKGDYIFELPDKNMEWDRVYIKIASIKRMVRHFTPFDASKCRCHENKLINE